MSLRAYASVMALTLISTGGTIASTRNSDGSVSVSLSGRDLLAGLPDQISNVTVSGAAPASPGSSAADVGSFRTADVEVIDLAVPGSWNLSTAVALSIAESARSALENGSDGVVVTHGTDVLEETAWLAELVLRPTTRLGPVVFTAAMRHAGEFGGDGPRNLADSLRVAADPSARDRGVLICLNGEVHHARWATKQHTTAVASFISPGRGPVGEVGVGGPVFHAASPPTPLAAAHTDGSVRLGGEVPVVTSHWDSTPGLIGWLLEQGAAGIVVEAGGAGNINGNLADGVLDALRLGVPIVVTSRCRSGSVQPIYGGKGGFATLVAAGAIGSSGLSAGKARLALQVALGAAASEGHSEPGAKAAAVRSFFRALDVRG